MKLLPWLRFFRIVNLPTVPGDVLVGAGVAAACSSVRATGVSGLLWGVAASCALYLYGLADNDIVGARKDGSDRPIPAGELSLGAARLARALCLLAVPVAGSVAGLPSAWWGAAFVIVLAIVVYNRKKWCAMMGLCRGANVICGGAVLLSGGRNGEQMESCCALAGVAIIWLVYIALVTKYSEGEDKDPAKKRRVGFLIGAIVYLQLGVLLAIYVATSAVWSRNLLLVGAGLLVVLRLMKRMLPKVSAS